MDERTIIWLRPGALHTKIEVRMVRVSGFNLTRMLKCGSVSGMTFAIMTLPLRPSKILQAPITGPLYSRIKHDGK